jgi:hypothetical protein
MEISFGTNPLLADTDRDGISDAVEVQYGMDPLAPGSALAPSVQGAGVAGLGSPQTSSTGVDPSGPDPNDGFIAS